VLHIEVNLVAVLVAGVAAFVLGWLWYSPLLFMKPWLHSRGLDPASMAGMKMPVGKMAGELLRCLVLAFFVAHIVGEYSPKTWMAAAHFGIFLWVTFPVLIYWGTALWENHSWKTVAIDAGDWLVKLLAVTLILFFMK